MAALKMFELGKLSAGHATQLANMSRTAFFETCSQYHISLFNYLDEEIAEQLDVEMEIIEEDK
ncbi:MAG: UPF0175 family protein [Thiotrichaceae bacterium]|nr:UPF0175 family protein [Thiotrichaceae bacterium]